MTISLHEAILKLEASLRRWDEMPEDEVDNDEYAETLHQLVKFRAKRDCDPLAFVYEADSAITLEVPCEANGWKNANYKPGHDSDLPF